MCTAPVRDPRDSMFADEMVGYVRERGEGVAMTVGMMSMDVSVGRGKMRRGEMASGGGRGSEATAAAMHDGRTARADSAGSSRTHGTCLSVVAHLHRRGRLPGGVVRMGRDATGARRRHHHLVRHRVLHWRRGNREVAVSESLWAHGIRDGRTLRALVVVVWVRVRGNRRRRH